LKKPRQPFPKRFAHDGKDDAEVYEEKRLCLMDWVLEPMVEAHAGSNIPR